MTSYWVSCASRPFRNRAIPKGKNLFYGIKLFPFKVDPYWQRRQNIVSSSSEPISIKYHCGRLWLLSVFELLVLEKLFRTQNEKSAIGTTCIFCPLSSGRIYNRNLLKNNENTWTLQMSRMNGFWHVPCFPGSKTGNLCFYKRRQRLAVVSSTNHFCSFKPIKPLAFRNTQFTSSFFPLGVTEVKLHG